MSFIYSLFQKCDLFGVDIEFNIENSKKSKTNIGGFLTIICFLIIIGAIWSMGNEMIYKNEPIIDIENVIMPKRPLITYTSTNFPISFCLQDYNQTTYNIQKYFEFDVSSIVTSTKNKSTLETPLEYENCTYSHFPKFSKEYVNNSGILDYLCLKDKKFSLEGYWDELYIKYLSIKIKICNNQTNNNTCAPIEEIQDWFRSNNVALNIYFGNNKINHRNYNDPVYSLIDVIYKDINLISSKIINIYLRSQEIETNIGLILNEQINKISYTYDYYDTDDSEYNSDSLMSIRLFASNKHLIYHRRYKKLQDLLAQIGGLKNALFLIAEILMYQYSKIKLNERIINKIYDFNPNRDKKHYVFNKIGHEFQDFKKKNLFNENNKHIITDNERSDIIRQTTKHDKYDLETNEKNSFNKSKLQMNIQNIIELKKSRSISEIKHNKLDKQKFTITSINISFCQYIKILICLKCMNKSKLKYIYDLYNLAYNDITYNLDIRNLVKLVEEIKLLKFVIFNYNQLVIFRYITNVLGTIEERTNFTKILGNIKDFNFDSEKMKTFISHYKNENRNNYSEIDERLIQFLS